MLSIRFRIVSFCFAVFFSSTASGNVRDIELAIGNAMYEEGRYADALRYFAHGCEHSGDWSVHSRCAYTFFYLGKLDEAEYAAQKSIALKADNPACFKLLALIAGDRNDHRTALMYFDKALSANVRIAEDGDTLFRYVQTLVHLGNHEKADRHLSDLLDVEPQNLVYLRYRALIQEKMLLFDEAEKTLLQIVRLHKNRNLARLNLARFYRRIKADKKAEDVEDAIKREDRASRKSMRPLK